MRAQYHQTQLPIWVRVSSTERTLGTRLVLTLGGGQNGNLRSHAYHHLAGKPQMRLDSPVVQWHAVMVE